MLAAAAAPAAELDKVRPLLETYCYRCHNAQLTSGGVDLTQFRTGEQVLAGRSVWERAYRVVNEREMPPVEPLPTPAERERLVEWIDGAIHNLDWDAVRRPGRVTLPRLTHQEYDNTIRDLTGLDLRLAADFPPDSAGESGFTNDREGLFVAPSLIERYMKAADTVVAELIAAYESDEPLRTRLEVEEMRITETNTPLKPWGYDLWKYQDTLYRYVRFPRFGRYRFRVRAWGESALEGELPGFTVRVGGEIVGQSQVAATAEEPRVYEFLADVPRGNHRVSLHWFKRKTAETNGVNRKLATERKRLVAEAKANDEPPPPAGRAVIVSLDFVEIEEALSPPQEGSLVFGRGPNEDDEAAARAALERFASRAYRRPATDREVGYLMERYRAAVERGESWPRAIGFAVKAVLVSPEFLFRVELGEGEAERSLNDYELASRLSYFLWLSMPDDRLFGLASEGRLSESETLRAEVRRMAADPKAEAFFETFPAQWLGYAPLGGTVKPDDVEFPDFSPALTRSMRAEATAFFAHLVREDRSLLDLLDADYAFLDEPLARHYGIEGVVGPERRRVPLGDAPRGGVLGMGAVLTATSLPVRTSPVVRGKWALETLLGEELPPPPPDASELPEASEDAEPKTLRELYAEHRRNETCATCHDRIDPIGFGLENYDAIGRWRTEDAGKPIDARGELPSGETFDGPEGLKSVLLRERERFARTVSETMLRFALGRGLRYYDEAAIREITAAVVDADYRAGALIEAIVESEPFLKQGPGEVGVESGGE